MFFSTWQPAPLNVDATVRAHVCVARQLRSEVLRHFHEWQNEVRVKTLQYNAPSPGPPPPVYEYFCIAAPVTVAALSNQLFTLAFSLQVKLLSAETQQ